jgi:hypothetical protein
MLQNIDLQPYSTRELRLEKGDGVTFVSLFSLVKKL